MSGEVKFGVTVDRWLRGTAANVPIMENRGTTGMWMVATGEVIQATNAMRDLEPGAWVTIVCVGGSWHLNTAAIPQKTKQ